MKRFISLSLICSLVLSLSLIAPAFSAPKMPWTKFSEAAEEAVGSGMAGVCINDQSEAVNVFVAVHKHGNEGWKFLFGVENIPGKPWPMVAYYYENPENDSYPKEVGFGFVDMKTEGAHDTIPTLKFQKFDPERHNEACAMLYPPKA